ncbi:hypothetical protein SAMN02745126_04411 [Enhydrobacter aerosaccus]|uniref:Membrane protein DedA, SNARE-associated domain n=1 Tax=Enhydrobacter aerosaccus TaxID=225324 RepID=A0A1T4S8E6_9HYPH|nr:hypothetical protein [Enhydrobacter aerosaccus]SKA24509.1 hypothetical protein SAMN02745126_04411 [Enhydrobacter aerosaccus]
MSSPARCFLLCDASGAVVWVTMFGLGGYLFGESILYMSGWITLLFGAVTALAMIAAWLFIRSREERLSEETERALPGPLRPDPSRAGQT